MQAVNLLSGEILRRLCPILLPSRVNRLANLLNEILPLYGITTPNRLHEFLANVLAESDGLCCMEENLNYSRNRLMRVWPKRFPTLDIAMKYAYNPKLLAMKVYGKRKELGNKTDLDGWTFRGSGPMQITGRANITAFGQWMQTKFGIMKTPEQWAHLIRVNDEYGIHSACWIFSIAFKLNDEAERDEMKAIIKKINGGYNGIERRNRYYQLCKQLIPQ